MQKGKKGKNDAKVAYSLLWNYTSSKALRKWFTLKRTKIYQKETKNSKSNIQRKNQISWNIEIKGIIL